ncbi:PREDICTED: AT-hook motif nuclear-localized protein 13-like isoform X2 [Brassica oleracea var. oleracea]|uniref:AT-hook motif nuclear-localized protein 13-like isoform X2 n=1 Tax=Brassica oleracea var. oleracea TaxID=109376 RepID=UPI0006A6AEB0|nr:PREDICTED: AT-hook motif nuclear-localized protein 13-like isoform X2 [Brassica oleracea var. oleracea]
MDSRELHQQQQQQHQHQHPQQQLQPPPGFLMGSYNRNPNAAAAALIGPTSTSQAMHHRLPFGSLAPHQPQHHQQQQQQQQQQLHPHQHHQPQPQHQMDQKTLESLGFEGSPSSVAAQQQQPMRFGIEPQAKKKRGRPRKYAADGNIGLALAPTSPASNSYGGGAEGGGGGDSGGGGNANSSDPPAKRNRGRPPGSGGTGGVGFTPHVIEVKTGEDIAMKVVAFTQQGPRAICILSATGAVSTVMLRQANNPNGAVKFEGPYEIISMSGSFLNTESNGTVTKTGSLSVSLARPDGQVVGGCVAGMLVAGSQVQVVVGSFVADGKKQKQSAGRVQNTPEPASAPANMLTFGGGGGQGSPRSQGQQHSSESSEENESNSPLHRGNNNNNTNHHGLFGNSTPQQLHQMPPMQQQMYHHHLWPGHNPQ